LHSHYLSFAHPVTGDILAFNSPLPLDLAQILEEIKKYKLE